MKHILWFTRYLLQLIGGFFIGDSIPVGIDDFFSIRLFTIGIVLILVSGYFNFFYRTKWEKEYNGGYRL